MADTPEPARGEVEVGGRRLTVTNLDKVLYPRAGFTKAHVIDYYVRIAPTLLVHCSGRPLTLRRYPDGVEAASFFEKRCPDHRPAWLPTVRLGGDDGGTVVDHCDVREVAALAWVANLAALELHTSLGRAPEPTVPTCVVFDLDPGAPAGLAACARVALLLREVCDRLSLAARPKTSGGKGLQVYVPLNTATDYARTRGFAHAVGQLLERRHPDLVTTNMGRAHRPGRVLVDWSQNHRTKTTVSVYSLRAQPRPTVSTPLTWDEVSDTADEVLEPRFEPADVLARVERLGDLFAPVEEERQQLPDLGVRS